MRNFTLCCAVGALTLIATDVQAGEGLFTPMTTQAKALSQDASYLALAKNPSTASLQLVQAKASAIRADATSLDFNVDGVDLSAFRLNSYTDESGNLVWSGIIESTSAKMLPRPPNYYGASEIIDDPLNSVTLVRNGDKITANLWVDGTLIKVRPLTSGGHAIVKSDGSKLPPDHPPEFLKAPVVPMKTDSSSEQNALAATYTLRVMVNYTAAAASQSGDINGLISLAVAESNQGYANSGVDISMVLANKSQVSYTETGNFTTDLNRYRGTSDGYMDSIHTTRNSSTADVGVLIVTNNAYCGLASGIGSTATTAFAEVYWDCATGYYSFAHEIGHLQSARHDPANDPTNTPYAYGHGYQYASGGWRTIMAYACTTSCTRLNYWSNPNKTYNGVPMGTTTRSHNQRVLNATAATVTSFR